MIDLFDEEQIMEIYIESSTKYFKENCYLKRLYQ